MTPSDLLAPEPDIRNLPSLNVVADLIGIDPSGITRALKACQITALEWGRREKHLTVPDVFRIARYAKRASLEEVGGGLMDWVEANHPDHKEEFQASIDAYFAALPEPKPQGVDAVVQDLIDSPTYETTR